MSQKAPIVSIDLKLAELIRNGDYSAFSYLYKLYYPKLFQYIRARTAHEEDAEDIVQEVFVDIWAKRETWNPQKHLVSYLYRSVTNRMLNMCRKKRPEYLEPYELDKNQCTDSDNADDGFAKWEVLEAVQTALLKIPSKRRNIIELRLMQEYSYREISDDLGISTNTVDTQIRRSVSTIRHELRHLMIGM